MNGFADCFGIGGIVLVRLHERFDELCGHEMNGMVHLCKNSIPVMSTATCLHADYAGRKVGDERV
uniref:Uncharacterized protein n=1 Tax=Candidatus Kentrum eta TaxID=2126337 RepID=A0A450VYX8_9GAMM|nr:MAG: hypothetical protein BECKH772C_GA0070978_106632 [Candidatus Kentron sp. H]